jgi:rhodanese-related sulfurtransferase
MALKVGVVIAIVLAVGSLLFMKAGGNISGSDARRLVETGAHLVDVRTPEEFNTGHVPGAVNIPVQELERRMGELSSKEQPVVVYCHSGNRSGRAARMLKSAGYAAVHDLGAMSRW